MNTDCVFCKIVAGENPADIVYEDENFVVFKNIDPTAPIHNLIVPKVHYESILDVPADVWDKMRKLAIKLGNNVEDGGFRISVNYGKYQVVRHLHMHFKSGMK
jgi:histidine triad (HIT) family protein